MKMQYEYANTKLASIPLSLLLIVSGLFGFVLLVPLNTARAAGPTVTLSATSATVGSSITITGTGFASGATIEITSVVGSQPTTIWLGGCLSDANSGLGSANSLVVAGCLTTDATGAFMTTVAVPELPGGPETITIYDGTSTVTSTLTITPQIQLCGDGPVVDVAGVGVKCGSDSVADVASGYPDVAVSAGGWLQVNFNGFAASDTVSVASNLFTSAFASAATCTIDKYGGCITGNLIGGNQFVPAESTGGAHTITATGTSGLTATTSFTIQPWVAFYDTQGTTTAFSFLSTLPTSILMEGHGFGNDVTIPASSVTLNGVVAANTAATTTSTGVFGAGAGNHMLISPSTTIFGPVDVGVAGTTFNFANGNIAMGTTGFPQTLGGVLIGSKPAIAGSTAVGVIDATTHTLGDTPTFFGYGFDTTKAVSVAATNLPGTGFAATAGTLMTGNAAAPDTNGAVFIETTGGLTSEPEGSYTTTYTQAVGYVEANIVSPGFTATPSLTLGNGVTNWDTAATSIDYTGDGIGAFGVITGGMFAASTSFSVKAGGNTLCSTGATTDALGNVVGCTLTPTVVALPGHDYYAAIDLASGTYTATGSDGTNTATDTFTIIPIVDSQHSILTQALTQESGAAGQVTDLRTTSSNGVHGLAANTAYTVNWGMVGATGAKSLGTFTSTSTGGVPVPGVQFAVPAGTAGDHLITLTQAGSDALFGVVFQDTYASGQTAPGTVGNSEYGDSVFVETISALISPTVANVGQTVTISGTGLAASKAYETSFTAQTAAALPGAQIFSTFTTDAGGNIPAGSTLVVPPLPAGVSGANPVGTCVGFEEKATTYYIAIQTASQYGTNGETGQGTIVIAGDAVLNMTSAAAGHAVTLTANGLCAGIGGGGATYDVIFNYGTNPQATLFTGTVVGAFTTNSQGSGTTTFTIPPGTAAGTYPINLVRVSPNPPVPNLGALSVLPSLTVAATVGSCSSLGTSCFTAGTPSKTTIGSFTGLSVTYTNAATGAVNGIAYAVVHNAAGQTVYYTTATISPAAGGTANAFLVLAGLPAGTYSVTIFVTDTTGVAISATTSTSVTLP